MKHPPIGSLVRSNTLGRGRIVPPEEWLAERNTGRIRNWTLEGVIDIMESLSGVAFVMLDAPAPVSGNTRAASVLRSSLTVLELAPLISEQPTYNKLLGEDIPYYGYYKYDF